MKILTILKLFFYGTLIIFNSFIVGMMYQIEAAKCPCAKEYAGDKFWYLFKKMDFLKYFSIVLSTLCLINMFIPLTKGISHIILIGGIISLLLLLGLILQAYLLVDLLNTFDEEECSKCKLGSLYEAGKFLVTASITTYSIVIILILLGLMYM